MGAWTRSSPKKGGMGQASAEWGGLTGKWHYHAVPSQRVAPGKDAIGEDQLSLDELEAPRGDSKSVVGTMAVGLSTMG